MFSAVGWIVRRVCPLLVLVSLASLTPAFAQSTTPQLPIVYLDTTYVSPTGSVINVPAGGDFQAALNTAQPGNVIVLQAGATFTGNFTLPSKSGTGWIYIQSSALASLPAGTRVSPSQAALMPKVISPNTSSALTAAPGAQYYRIVGVEITGSVTNTNSTQYALVALDTGSDFVIDRCYIHGTPTGNYQRGIELNSARTAVIDSYLADFHSTAQEAQAIAGWNGPGPFKIANNELDGAAQSVLFGGADPSVANLVPSDIEIRGNHFDKPLSWRQGDPSYAGIPWIVKNLLELKNAQRVLIDGNLIEHTWQAAQGGTAILFTVRDQGGTAPWSAVQDVTFTNNIVQHAGSGIGMHGWDDLYLSQHSTRFLIQNNFFTDISSATWGGNGRLFEAWKGVLNLAIAHNTGFMDQAVMMAGYTGYGTTCSGTPYPCGHNASQYTNNLTVVGVYGFTGDGTAQGTATLTAYFPGNAFPSPTPAVFAGNVLVGGSPAFYPSGNYFPSTLNDVGFVDLAGGNYALSATSPYKNAGTDGTDIGADFTALDTATACALSGACAAPSASTTAFSLSPTSLPFGSVPVGTTSAASDVWVTNTGTTGISVSGITVSGPFAVSSTDCYPTSTWNGVMAPGTHCNVWVVFDPVTSGSATGMLTVTAGGSSSTVALSGTGVTDVTPPVISSVTAASITASGATITWTTNEPSDSQVEYGLTMAYGSVTPLNTTLVTSHSQALSGLAPNTLYHYRVKSRDAAGNLAVSGDFTFKTKRH